MDATCQLTQTMSQKLSLQSADTEDDSRASPVSCEYSDGDSATSTFTIPDDESRDKILAMVEHLFSDENLMKDAFLLKHVKRNKEGFVSVKLIASLRKLKCVCKHWKQLAYTVDKCSSKLVINDDGTKIRRVQKLPECLELKVSKKTSPVHRQILLTNIERDQFNVEALSELLTPYGAISVLRLYESLEEPQLHSWTPVLTSRVEKKKPCALVEFESSCSALSALLAIQALCRTNWRFTIQPFSLKHAVTAPSVKRDATARRRANTYAHETDGTGGNVQHETRRKCDSCSSLVSPVKSKRTNSVITLRQPHGPTAAGERGFR